ncbi:hypothetical protein CASFOL_012071 [Castilleja foliolosa]|uniref:Uncharacterized protein n=1 Tax=Castilleja foliolosa TaxID=1961234 RepID=A0ABD3DTE5_9LAMI
MALCPKSGCIASFCCPGKGKKHKKNFTDMIDTAFETYQVVKGMRSNTLSKPKWVYPKVLHMDKPYSSDDIDDVRRSWAKCFPDDIR